MNILVVGGGGREHALVKMLRKSPRCGHIWALPGNGGLAGEAECVDIPATDLAAIRDFAASHEIGLAVIGPDDPLALGLVDILQELGLPCFGPSRAAARLEASKSFAKGLMAQHHIPTAAYALFDDYDRACAYVRRQGAPIVIKADGLALGKGVTVAQSLDEAIEALTLIMRDKVFGSSGDRVLIEECLSGPEVTVLALCDGHTLIPLPASMDHKRLLDGDLGPNTGGMGVIAPNPFYTPEIAQQCLETIFLPTVRAMEHLGSPFKGCLYFGLMLTPEGPKVIEYNSRFGDPEAQAVLPLLRTDLLELLLAVAEERLDGMQAELLDAASCCVVLASSGYPGKYAKGLPIRDEISPQGRADLTVFYAGVSGDGQGTLLTNGGRVLCLTALAPTLDQAQAKCYASLDGLGFEGACFRRDIGAKALTGGKI